MRLHAVCAGALALAAICFSSTGSLAQYDASQQSATVPSQGSSNSQEPPVSEEQHRMLARMQKEANKKREADLKRDTNQLLKLATELKVYVDKSNENILSVDVVKKADQIEKLAHSVKTKMAAQ